MEDELSMRFVCGSLAMGAAGLCCALAFLSQTPPSSFLVATHGAVLGTTLAPRAEWKRADTFHALALMAAVAVEFFVFTYNPNMTLNFVTSVVVVAHMAWFFVWSMAQRHGREEVSLKQETLKVAYTLRELCEVVLETAAIAGCAIVDCVLAPTLGFVQLAPFETTAPTFVCALALSRALPHLRWSAEHHDSLAVSGPVSIVLVVYAICTTISGWYVQCAYAWSLFGLVITHFLISLVLYHSKKKTE